MKAKNDRNKGKKRARQIENKNKRLKCFQCHKEGHFKRDYREKKPKKKEKNIDTANMEGDGYQSVGVCVTT